MKHQLLTTLALLATAAAATDSNLAITTLPAAAQAVAKDAGARIAPNPPLPRVATKEELIGDKCHRLLTNLAELDNALRVKRPSSPLASSGLHGTVTDKNNTTRAVRENAKLVQNCQRLCERLGIETETDWLGIEQILNGDMPATTFRRLNFSPTTIIKQLNQIIAQIQNPSSLPTTYPPTFIPITQSDIGTGSCGYTISSPGSYRLVEDITYTPTVNGAAICIQRDYVTLDLNGRTLATDASGGAANISAIEIGSGSGYGHITIQNGTITLASPSITAGITLNDGTNAHGNIHIHDIIMHKPSSNFQSSGIFLSARLDGALIERTTITGTYNQSFLGDGRAIEVEQLETTLPYTVEVSNNIVAITTHTGILLDHTSSETTNAIAICKNNLCIGIDLGGISTFNYLFFLPDHSYVGNNIALNSGTGYEIRTNQNVPFFNNYAHGNTTNYSGFGAGPSTSFPYDFSIAPTTAKYWTNVGV